MTVKDLIEVLQRFPPDAPVWCRIDEYVDDIGRAELQNKTWSEVPIVMLESL